MEVEIKKSIIFRALRRREAQIMFTGRKNVLQDFKCQKKKSLILHKAIIRQLYSNIREMPTRVLSELLVSSCVEKQMKNQTTRSINKLKFVQVSLTSSFRLLLSRWAISLPSVRGLSLCLALV